MTLRLHSIWYSPWSVAARWALDHHHIAYRKIEHLPMLSVPRLRWATRRFRGKVTAPVLLTEQGVLTDSFDIARYSERHGTGQPLFPARRDRDIESWNERSQALLRTGRQLTTRDIANSPDALREAMPAFLRKVPGALAAGRSATSYVLRKYPVAQTASELVPTMRQYLQALRDGLGEGAGDHLLDDTFSYADIIAAVSLQGVLPPAYEYMPMGPATRACWTRSDLAEEFADLMQWRDRMYQRHFVGTT